ncbi:MAG: glycolate oxidase subunit GlcE [Gammaproteobacteria bacterium]
MIDNDIAEALRQSVAEAIDARTPLCPVGGGSKAFFGRKSAAGKPFPVGGHQGIVNYQPSELVITARAGTPLAEIDKILGDRGQMLGFEPPSFSGSATLGGSVASGLSGPRRPFAGAARDFVLGCRLIDGRGDLLKFGGEVMKNVAGYDASRLMAGSMGTLGVLMEVSLKVLPRPARETTCRFELKPDQARRKMIEWSARCLPVSGISYEEGMLRVRLSGLERTVRAAIEKLGGETEDSGYWRELTNQQRPFFRKKGEIWRIAVPPAEPDLQLSGEWLYDWGGALRWLNSDEPAERIFDAAHKAEGHATLFRSEHRSDDVFQPMHKALKALNKNIKAAFDPEGIFSPGRVTADW